MMQKTAVVFGASGLVGSEVIKILLSKEEFGLIILPVRKIVSDYTSPKIKQLIIDFDSLDLYANELKGDCYFLCLGTTMAKAKSKEAFYKVDFTYTYEAAKIAVKNNSSHVLLISSMGADEKSMIYYSKVKGKIEKALEKLPLSRLTIFRPSLLLGNRNESRSGEKWAEKISSLLSFMFFGPFKNYKPVKASDVAEKMVRMAMNSQSERVKILLSSELNS
ncbi:MAG: NAD-dependent epimerase/dehydratase family protein [Saprospiraceae bacterium]|nr:NAD-dependent epimerase/dehydratase family protein [Saprospiraceae bacterium]